MMIGNLLRAFTACLIVTSLCQSAHADRADANVQIMIDAARKLEFALPENRAYLLVKHATDISAVGVIFGYVDNAAACEQIAEASSNLLRVGTYKCSPAF